LYYTQLGIENLVLKRKSSRLHMSSVKMTHDSTLQGYSSSRLTVLKCEVYTYQVSPITAQFSAMSLRNSLGVFVLFEDAMTFLMRRNFKAEIGSTRKLGKTLDARIDLSQLNKRARRDPDSFYGQEI